MLVVVAQANLIHGLTLSNPPTNLYLQSSKDAVVPGETVTFFVVPQPPDASGTVTLRAFVGGVVKGEWSLSLPDHPSLVLVPSAVSSSLITWTAYYGNSVMSNAVQTLILTATQPPVSLSLTATRDISGLTTFSVVLTPTTGSYAATLEVFDTVLCTRRIGVWSLPINNGVGSITLKPSEVMQGMSFWKATADNVESNVLAVNGSVIVSLKDILTWVGVAMAVVGAVVAVVFRKS